MRDEIGGAHVYGLNREHLLAPAIDALAATRSEFFDRLRLLAAGWSIQPHHLSVFGSMARGDGDAASDIDLFLVRPEPVDLDDELWRQQVHDLSARVEAWTGNRASLVEVSVDELAELVRTKSPILDAIRADAVDIVGRTARQVTRS